ncbi:hypothetical protein [Flavobacterium pedocola]
MLAASCSVNDEAQNEEKKPLTETLTNRPPSMSVNCVNNFTPPNNYNGIITWNLGLTIPYSEASAYIEIKPRTGSTVFSSVNIPIPYLGPMPSSINVIHTGSGTFGSAWLSGGQIFINTKEFDYRYIIYDNDSPAYVATGWKYHDLTS